jgi:DNA-binding transcriptional LysR family regulator
MDKLVALRVFRQVVELGSFAAAARRLGLSPAAASKNISELERQLGARLMERTTRQMNLTEAGRLYYEQIARALDEIEEADGSLGPLQTEPRGVLRVSAPMTLTLTCLSASIPEFLERYPGITLDLRMDDRRVNLIEEGYDVAIRGVDQLQDTSLIARRLMPLRQVLCAAPTYLDRCGSPGAPEDVARHNCIQFSLSQHVDAWTFRKGGESIEVPVSGRYRVSSSLAVRDALLAGFGLALIPLVYVKEEIERGRLHVLLDQWATIGTMVYAVYPSRRHVGAKLRAFLDFVTARFREVDQEAA